MSSSARGIWLRRAFARWIGLLLGGVLPLAMPVGAQSVGPVAAYGFEEGAGAIVSDASGSGNAGAIRGAVWTAGRFGSGLEFDGTSLVEIADSPSLDLSSSMTLEAWVYPTVVDGTWKDVVFKDVDIYFLEGTSPNVAPAVGGTFSGSPLYGPGALPANTWSHLAATYDGAALRLYVDGVEVASRPQTGRIQTSSGDLTIGGNSSFGQHWIGRIDEVRVYHRALDAAEIQDDMNTPVVQAPPDPNPPSVSLASPAPGETVTHVIGVSASATDDVGVSGVEFLVDGLSIGTDVTAPYVVSWNTTMESDGAHTLTAQASDAAGNETTSDAVVVTSLNPGFVNEVVVPNIVSATTIAFLPDGRMLVGELIETIWIVQPGANQPDAVPFLQLDSSQLLGEQGLMDICLDPDFGQNGHYYVFYTRGRPGQNNHNRVSRFTASGNTTLAGSEVVLWEDDVVAQNEHHGGALAFGSDGKLYITYGDQFLSDVAQRLDNFRGKILRINPDGSVPTDNPFHDGPGPNRDAIWALGLRNPFRMSIDPATGRIFVGDVGGNDHATAQEEINIGVAGANYGWPLCEGPCNVPGTTDPVYWYPHNGRDASITGGFVYRGSQFPSEYSGSYFFADYVQNWFKRLTFDAAGNLDQAIDFEPPDGSTDGPYGDPVKLIEGPDGSLYYVDIGFNDQHVPNPAAIRRIRFVLNNEPPVASVSAAPTSGLPPLVVSFSSAGSFDPEGQPLSYDWDFGDGATSTQANPTHTYQQAGPYVARLRLSDGENTTLSADLDITVGNPPVATITTPADGRTFRAGDVIAYAGSATDVEDGVLPASAFTWAILFHHDSHNHPAGGPFTNTTSGSLTIPTAGHDFAGNTSYEIILSVTDSDGLRDATSVTVYPDKVDLSFETLPGGLAVDLDGIRRTTPFVHDAVIGFHYTINAPQQTVGGADYYFNGWSDAGAQSHAIVVPDSATTYVAAFNDGTGLVGTVTALAARKSGATIALTFAPACGAADHALFWGTSPITGNPAWSGAVCGLGTSGAASFDPGVPPVGRFIYWVLVGQSGSFEGSYGQRSDGAERPEATGIGICDLPLSPSSPCP